MTYSYFAFNDTINYQLQKMQSEFLTGDVLCGFEQVHSELTSNANAKILTKAPAAIL